MEALALLVGTGYFHCLQQHVCMHLLYPDIRCHASLELQTKMITVQAFAMEWHHCMSAAAEEHVYGRSHTRNNPAGSKLHTCHKTACECTYICTSAQGTKLTHS